MSASGRLREAVGRQRVQPQDPDGADTRFRTSDQITTLDADELSSRSGLAPTVNVITVRRFERGTVLAELLSPETEDTSARLLKQAAAFLAYIHAAPGRAIPRPPRSAPRCALGCGCGSARSSPRAPTIWSTGPSTAGGR